MKNLQKQLEQIRAEAAECLLTSDLAANGKTELFATLPQKLRALALQVEETIATNDERAVSSRQLLLWSLAIVLATIVGTAFFWVSNGAEKDSPSGAILQSKPESSPALQDHGQAAMGLPLSIYQGDRKVLTEQLGTLAARVEILENNLERARAEIARSSNKQSVDSEQNPTAAETKTSTPVENPVRSEEKRSTMPEKPAAALPATGNPVTEPAEQGGAIAVPKQAELDLPKRAIGPPGCTHFRSFDPVSGSYTSFDGRRRPCR
jgi:BA14K-like protein